MNHEQEIAALKAQVSELQAKVNSLTMLYDDLCKAQNNDRREAAKATNEVNQYFCQVSKDIYDYLWPLVHKVFPHWAETNKQIDTVLGKSPPTNDTRKNP